MVFSDAMGHRDGSCRHRDGEEAACSVPGAVFEGLMQDEQALLFVSVKPGAAWVVCHVGSRG